MVLFTWIAFKLFIKKVWTWVRNYWHFPLVFVWTIMVWVFSRRNGEAALEVLLTSKKSYEAQIDVLKKSHVEEIEKRDKALFFRLNQYSVMLFQQNHFSGLPELTSPYLVEVDTSTYRITEVVCSIPLY